MINELDDDEFLEMFMELGITNVNVEDVTDNDDAVCRNKLIDTFTEWLNTALHEINDKESL